MIEPPAIIKDPKDLPEGVQLTDAYDGAVSELFRVRNPHVKKGSIGYVESFAAFEQTSGIQPIYIYYPHLKRAIRTVPEAEYFELRTARNKLLITDEEQQHYRKGKVAVAGLSVGSSIVRALVLSGGPKSMSIADFDSIEMTNLNRLQFGLPSVGEQKLDATVKFIWELDPFAQIEQFPEGLKNDNLERFIGSPAADVIIDEVESLEIKIKLRILAKKRKLPVLMATDVGNGIVLDVERFDQDSDLAIFHGLISEADIRNTDTITEQEWLSLTTKIIGPEYLTDRMRESILSIGRRIPSVPQLGTAAVFAGVAVAYAARRILTKQKLSSGRYAYSLEDLVGESESISSGDDFLKSLNNKSA